jgi:hypothetical protein
MSYTRVKTVNFGTSRSGLSTVQYSLNGGSTWSGTGVTESPSSTGIYRATITFTDGFTGTLTWRDGGSPVRYAAEEVNAADATSLPDPAPDGYGPIGTGSVAVDHDYPTANNLKFATSGGQGIGGALVRAYLASEYASSPAAATIRGQTLTLDSGAWANVIDLDPGSYQVVFKAEGFETTVVSLTVS